MKFTLRCPCGESLRVAHTDAACAKRCRCGSEFQIPRLSILRRLEAEGTAELPPVRVGETPERLPPVAQQPEIDMLSVAQKLHLLALDGHLPVETRCLQCALSTDHVLECVIECELPEVYYPPRWLEQLISAALLVFSPLHGMFHLARATDAGPVTVNDEVIVRAPLRICPDCADKLHHDRQRVRELVQQMSLYEPLFREYPAATIAVSRGK